MKTIRYIALALLAVSPLCAQRYLLKDGKILKQDEVVLKGNVLVKSLGGDAGEMQFPIAQVVRLDWPEPTEIAEARTLLASGKEVEAEAKITPIYKQFTPFAKIPGGWWNEAALLRARVLLALKKNAETEKATKELIATTSDEDIRQGAELISIRLQLLLGKRSVADTMLEVLMRKEVSGEIAAGAAVLRGDIAYEIKDFERALEFYLLVPAFYGNEVEVMPAALLGSARSFRGYGDSARTERAYLDLIAAFPSSAEAILAKREMNGP
jgi:tetratricopeptide (TPR) repeat protein